jgi:hypothetical protein
MVPCAVAGRTLDIVVEPRGNRLCSEPLRRPSCVGCARKAVPMMHLPNVGRSAGVRDDRQHLRTMMSAAARREMLAEKTRDVRRLHVNGSLARNSSAPVPQGKVCSGARLSARDGSYGGAGREHGGAESKPPCGEGSGGSVSHSGAGQRFSLERLAGGSVSAPGAGPAGVKDPGLIPFRWHLTSMQFASSHRARDRTTVGEFAWSGRCVQRTKSNCPSLHEDARPRRQSNRSIGPFPPIMFARRSDVSGSANDRPIRKRRPSPSQSACFTSHGLRRVTRAAGEAANRSHKFLAEPAQITAKHGHFGYRPSLFQCPRLRLRSR